MQLSESKICRFLACELLKKLMIPVLDINYLTLSKIP